MRTVRNDGTFPGTPTGGVLIRRGAVGFVRDVGTFLQDQLIYSIHFLDENILVGCREQELQGADEPWVPSLFEFRDKVTPRIQLAVNGEVIAKPGDEGEVLKAFREAEDNVTYHVRFPGRTLQVPEKILEGLDQVSEGLDQETDEC